MDKRELEMASIQEIFDDLSKGVPIKRIARLTKTSKNTIKKYRDILKQIKEKSSVNLTSVQIYDEYKKARDNIYYSDNFGWLNERKEYLEELVTQCSNYVRLLEVLNEKGYTGSYSSLTRYLTKNKIHSEAPIIRIETMPGESAQVDFGYVGRIFDDNTGTLMKAWVFVMTLGFSRHAYYEIVKSQDIQSWCNCHINAFEYFNGVPEIVVPDNLKSAIIKATFLDPIINKSYGELATHYGFQVDPCIPRVAKHKGKVESGVKYVKNNFIPLRIFSSFSDANEQLKNWNNETACLRTHGTTRRKPISLFNRYELKKLKPLASNRFEIPIFKTLKVYKDIHIQFDNAYYSVPCHLKNEYVLARKTDSQMAIFYDNALIAVHRPVGKGARATDYSHYPENKTLYMRQDTKYCLSLARRIGDNAHKIINRILVEEPIRNLRGAQNILRLKDKFSSSRLEDACKRALYFNNIDYYSIKNILIKKLDQQMYIDDSPRIKKELDSSYAINIKQLLQG